MNQMNGQGGSGLPPGLPPMPQGNVVSPEQAINIMEGAIGPAFTLVLKGVQASFPGVPPHFIMIAACKVLGHLVGGTFAGMNAPLVPLMKARTECREMFEKSLKEIPLNAAAGGSTATAMPIPPKPQG